MGAPRRGRRPPGSLAFNPLATRHSAPEHSLHPILLFMLKYQRGRLFGPTRTLKSPTRTRPSPAPERAAPRPRPRRAGPRRPPVLLSPRTKGVAPGPRTQSPPPTRAHTPRHLPPQGALRRPSNSPLAGRRVRGARWTRHSSRSGRLWRRAGGRVPSPLLLRASPAPGQAGTAPEDGARPPPPAGHVSQSSQDSPCQPRRSLRHPGVLQPRPPLPRPLRMRRSARGSHSNRQRPASFGPANRRRGGRGEAGRGGV